MKISQEQSDALGGCAPCQSAPVPRAAASGGGGSGPPPKSVVIVDPTKPGWIVVELADPAKRPVPNEAYVVTLPNGELLPGTLDQNGYLKGCGFGLGQYQFCGKEFRVIRRVDNFFDEARSRMLKAR